MKDLYSGSDLLDAINERLVTCFTLLNKYEIKGYDKSESKQWFRNTTNPRFQAAIMVPSNLLCHEKVDVLVAHTKQLIRSYPDGLITQQSSQFLTDIMQGLNLFNIDSTINPEERAEKISAHLKQDQHRYSILSGLSNFFNTIVSHQDDTFVPTELVKVLGVGGKLVLPIDTSQMTMQEISQQYSAEDLKSMAEMSKDATKNWCEVLGQVLLNKEGYLSQ